MRPPGLLDEKRAEELTLRLPLSALVHLPLFALVVAATPARHLFAAITWITAGMLVAMAGLRLALIPLRRSLPLRSWGICFGVATAATAASWGIFNVAAVGAFGIGEAGAIICVVAAGISAGAVASLAADSRLAALYLTLLLLPLIVRLPAFGFMGTAMAATILCFLIFTVVQGRRNEAALVALWTQQFKLAELVETLDVANQRANSAAGARAQFLANMSHEIRTPLNSVLGNAELLLDSPLEPARRQQLQALHASAEHLLTLFNDLLDLSKAEAGQLTLELTPTAIGPLVERAVDVVRPAARDKGLAIDLDLSPQLPGRLLIDPLRVRQVLGHLLANAVKFTDRGKVTVRVQADSVEGQAPVGDRRVRLRVFVDDTGPGIMADRLGRLFEPFAQGDASDTRRHGGSGIGLVISRRLLTLMNGHIAATSEPGRGSTFWFEIDAPVVTAPAPREEVAGGEAGTPLGGRRALVVEDNIFNQKVMEGLLRKLGCQVTMVANGVEALERLAAEHHDFVLMDCQMPVMDGYEATQRLRADDRWRQLPVIGVTAHALAEDLQRCLDVGMNGYLTKPISLRTLSHALSQHLTASSPEIVAPGP